MPLFSKPQLDRAYEANRAFMGKTASVINEGLRKSVEGVDRFDVFLSHRYLDRRRVLALRSEIMSAGYTVFVDWIEYPQLDRSKVTRQTAGLLRKALGRCDCLLYAVSPNSDDSKWMPWELGYSDGKHGKAAIVPILDVETDSESYDGQEYLGLYPYVTMASDQEGDPEIWINRSETTYASLWEWLGGLRPYRHP